MRLDLQYQTKFTQGASYWVYDVGMARIVSTVYDNGYFEAGYCKLKAVSVRCQLKNNVTFKATLSVLDTLKSLYNKIKTL